MRIDDCCIRYVFLVFRFGSLLTASPNVATVMSPLTSNNDPTALRFQTKWDTLGPFKIGTREAVWGADPLESLGGFRNLEVEYTARYPSPLARNATVSWHTNYAILDSSYPGPSALLNVSFPDIDWEFTQSVYGWAALQYQAWTRGVLFNPGPADQKIALYTDNILELWINEEHIFGGDFYSFRRAPAVISLKAGKNILNVRLVRDVRAMGANRSPSIMVRLAADVMDEILTASTVGQNFPDLVDGCFSSPFASVILRNNHDHWIQVEDCTAIEGLKECDLARPPPLRIAPGQSRPVSLKIASSIPAISMLKLRLKYRLDSGPDHAEFKDLDVAAVLNERSLHEPHKITYLHPSLVVSYAILKPPPCLPTTHRTKSLPILLNLHGAGLEADSHQVRHQLDSISNLQAWVLFPTGTSPWSGDDWHTWAIADINAAVAAISDWIECFQWTDSNVNADRWLVSGHSNGGQGTWFIASHQPDKVIAAAPVSGYSSIENYVPYHMWEEADPHHSAILHTARASFRHELLVQNLEGIPILQQHGGDDDNVPPYHSRLMNALLKRAGLMPQFVELPDTSHWFDGAMETEHLRNFYERQLQVSHTPRSSPKNFEMIVPNSYDMGSRHGIEVDQLESPDRLGRLSVSSHLAGDRLMWKITTSNIRRMHLNLSSRFSDLPDLLQMDDGPTMFHVADFATDSTLSRSADGEWKLEEDRQWHTVYQRRGRQRGALDSFMRTTGPFQIISCIESGVDTAIQISRNLLQYFGADAEVCSCSLHASAVREGGNVITVIEGSLIPTAFVPDFPLSIESNGIRIHQNPANRSKIIVFEPGLGAIFLRPLNNERLELVVWGFDNEGLRLAARLVPTLTGVGQPDFIILNNKARWLGHGGALAMGFLTTSGK